MTPPAPAEAIIEVSIPLRYFDDTPEKIDCPICAHVMCPDDECGLTSATLTCCDQAVCAGCFVKILKRCRCTAECKEIVGTCPFCREMCRSTAMPIFLARKSPCRGCKTK